MLAGLNAPSGHFVHTGRIAASTRLGDPVNQEGVLLGVELGSRAEAKVGARWEGGLMLGWGSGPAALGGRVGLEAFGELGTPLRSTLLAHGDFYAGAALGVPLYLGSARQVQDLNRSTAFVTRRFELMPMLRTRVQRGHAAAGHTVDLDVSLGLMMRLRMISDLF
jgi:hypothetical protein